MNEDEYSDLFKVSGTCFLSPIEIEISKNDSKINHDMLLLTPTKHSNTPSNLQNSNLIDTSISAFDLLPAAISPSTPSSRHRSLKFNHSNSNPSNLPRTQSVDLIALQLQQTPKPSIPRSKSTNSLNKSPHPIQTQNISSKVSKSILKRPNSPSKRTRARFFSPSLSSSDSSQDHHESHLPDWIDQNGNFRAHEIIHEFQHDQPPNVRPQTTPLQPLIKLTPPKLNIIPTPSYHRRHSHTPRFTVPEPIELGIEPILPRRSTSPSPSPPSLPPSSYLINLKPHTHPSDHLQSNRSASSSLLLNTSENLSNILDQSAGFLVGNDTTLTSADNNPKDPSTELSIDLNHVAMIQTLGKKTPWNRSITSSGVKNMYKKLAQCQSVPEEEDSVDVCGLAKQLEDTERFPFGNSALNDEQAPMNLQESSYFSTTFESSLKVNIPPLLTDEIEIWKNSIPINIKDEQNKKSLVTQLPTNSSHTKFVRPKTKSMSNLDTSALTQKIEKMNLTHHEKVENRTRFKLKDDLFTELTSSSITSQKNELKSIKNETAKTSTVSTVNNRLSTRRSTRPSTGGGRLSGPIAFPSKPLDKSVISVTSPISSSRLGSIPRSRVSFNSRRNSNIGIGLPSSSSVPNMTKLATMKTVPMTNIGNRTKLKPSNAIIKPHSTAGSPKLIMKTRSSISNQNINSYKIQHSSPKPSTAINHPSPTTTMTLKMPGKKIMRPSTNLSAPNLPSSSGELCRTSAPRTSCLSRLPNPTSHSIKRNSNV